MDHLPSSSFLSTRYAPPPFSADSNFHNHHHHLPTPPPPHQHLPPPPTYRPNPLPPPPPPQQQQPPHPYNLHRPSQYNFPNSNPNPSPSRPIEDDRSRSFHQPPSPRLSHRLPTFQDDRPPRHLVPEIDRFYPPVDSDRHRSFVQSRRIDVYRHEPEGSSSRFREDHSDQHAQRDNKYVWGRIDAPPRRTGRSFDHDSPLTNSRGIGIEQSYNSSSRGSEHSSYDYNSRYGLTSDGELSRGGRDEHQRWVLGRQSSGGSYEMGHIDADGGRMFFRESGRYNNGGSLPRKQVQKKSAFLRIQNPKPSHKARDSEHSQYSAYFGDSSSNSFRGKDHGRERETKDKDEEEREGSPVELDVSFKSNSLVAKAIVTPPSSAHHSDTNVTPRHRKIRKVTPSDKDCSSSLLSKFDEDASRLESAVSVVNNSPSSGRELKQLEKKVTASGSLNTIATSSKPHCDGTNNLNAKAQVESSPKDMNTNKSGANAVSAKTSSPKIVKKKKVPTATLR